MLNNTIHTTILTCSESKRGLAYVTGLVLHAHCKMITEPKLLKENNALGQLIESNTLHTFLLYVMWILMLFFKQKHIEVVSGAIKRRGREKRKHLEEVSILHHALQVVSVQCTCICFKNIK